uniref:Uncharacterized protein n=1 Tax=Ditylenchus dipsaci TaxID=166011 RepID=A0A915DUG6_9BILA
MITRRSKRMEEKEKMANSQEATPGTLLPLIAPPTADQSSASQPKVEEKSPVVESPSCSKSSVDLSQASGSTTPRNARPPNPSGYSLRTYRKRPSRVYSPEAASPREVRSTKSSTVECEPTKSLPTTSTNAKKITVEEDSTPSSKISPAPSTSSSCQPLRYKKTPKPKMLSLPTSEARKVRYGWFLQDMDSMPVVQSSEKDSHSADPDDYVCFNEKKAWAGEYIMCIGQQNLCKWM